MKEIMVYLADVSHVFIHLTGIMKPFMVFIKLTKMRALELQKRKIKTG